MGVSVDHIYFGRLQRMCEEGNIYRTGLTGDDCGEQTTLSIF
jgi:hypothetical protein